MEPKGRYLKDYELARPSSSIAAVGVKAKLEAFEWALPGAAQEAQGRVKQELYMIAWAPPPERRGGESIRSALRPVATYGIQRLVLLQ